MNYSHFSIVGPLNYLINPIILTLPLQVNWFKENVKLTPSNKIRMETKEASNRHTLILRGLSSQQDFGNYSCVAENSLGSSK